MNIIHPLYISNIETMKLYTIIIWEGCSSYIQLYKLYKETVIFIACGEQSRNFPPEHTKLHTYMTLCVLTLTWSLPHMHIYI